MIWRSALRAEPETSSYLPYFGLINEKKSKKEFASPPSACHCLPVMNNQPTKSTPPHLVFLCALSALFDFSLAHDENAATAIKLDVRSIPEDEDPEHGSVIEATYGRFGIHQYAPRNGDNALGCKTVLLFDACEVSEAEYLDQWKAVKPLGEVMTAEERKEAEEAEGGIAGLLGKLLGGGNGQAIALPSNHPLAALLGGLGGGSAEDEPDNVQPFPSAKTPRGPRRKKGDDDLNLPN
jgi:hypothetical protein